MSKIGCMNGNKFDSIGLEAIDQFDQTSKDIKRFCVSKYFDRPELNSTIV